MRIYFHHWHAESLIPLLALISFDCSYTSYIYADAALNDVVYVYIQYYVSF